MPVADHLTPEQAREVNAILSATSPELARSVALQLSSDPVAIEVSRMRAEMSVSLHSLSDGMRDELRSLGAGMRDEQRSLSESIRADQRTTTRYALLLVLVALVLSAVISAAIAKIPMDVSLGQAGLSVQTTATLELDTDEEDVATPAEEPSNDGAGMLDSGDTEVRPEPMPTDQIYPEPTP